MLDFLKFFFCQKKFIVCKYASLKFSGYGQNINSFCQQISMPLVQSKHYLCFHQQPHYYNPCLCCPHSVSSSSELTTQYNTRLLYHIPQTFPKLLLQVSSKCLRTTQSGFISSNSSGINQVSVVVTFVTPWPKSLRETPYRGVV